MSSVVDVGRPVPEPRRDPAPRRFWSTLLWSIIYPQRAHRIIPTIPGTVLIALSLGIGMAAYNSSSNILFLTLALLLTCLILSGVLSWLNLRKVTWRLRVAPALRVGHETLIGLELDNAKSFVPTYALWFNFLARPQRPPGEQRAESTLRANSDEIRAAFAQAEAAEIRGRAPLAGRLDPRGRTRVDWVMQPTRRGILRVELASVGSLFPFGFLRKEVGTSAEVDTTVWPATIEYRRHSAAAAFRQAGEERVARAGSGSDLIAVRRYNTGDSHRLIHWKASARTGQLLVRQYSAESAQGYVLWLRTDAPMWPRAEQFEVLVRLAATLAENLFRTGKLMAVAINDEPAAPVRRVRDLEAFLDQLAVVATIPAPSAGLLGRGQSPVLTFVPDGARGVSAQVDGQVVASA